MSARHSLPPGTLIGVASADRRRGDRKPPAPAEPAPVLVVVPEAPKLPRGMLIGMPMAERSRAERKRLSAAARVVLAAPVVPEVRKRPSGMMIGIPRRERVRAAHRVRRRRLAHGIAIVVAAACGGGERSAVETAVSVIFDQDTYTLAGIGESATVRASTVDAERRPIAGTSIAWRSSNAAVATVDTAGKVTAVGDGVARIWAVSGKDSAFAVVVVERPPARFTLLPGTLHFDALGATASLQVRGEGDTAISIAAVCQSADTGIVAVDTAGIIVSRGNGRTRVRCQIGEMEDSVGVEVRQTVARVAVVRQGPVAIRAGRDSFPLQLAQVDRLGAPIEGSPVRWSSLTPDVVKIDSANGVAVGLIVGEGKVTGIADGKSDTVIVQVLDPNAAALPPVMRPRLPVDRRGRTIRIAREQRDRTQGIPVVVRSPAETDSIIRTQILQGGSQARITQSAWRKVTMSATVMSAEHRVDQGLGLEHTSGLMFGGEVDYLASRRLRLRALGMTGKLTPKNGTTNQDRYTSDGRLEASLIALPWLSFQVGGSRRVYASKINDVEVARQGWWMLRTGGEARFALADGAVETTVRFTLLPIVSVSPSTTTRPSLGSITGAGVEYRTGALSTGIDYSLERYDFPSQGGATRREQFASLRLRLGLQFGR